MDTSTPLRPLRRPLSTRLVTAAALACLALAYGVARTLDRVVDLANLAMVFVLASTLVAFWLPVWASALFSVAGVVLFNWTFVPPRGSFSVDGHQNLLLLGTLLGVSLSIGLLMGRLRRQAALARRRTEQAQREAQAQSLRSALTAMADNTLQLVRLEAGEVELRRDWESLEELIGAVLARVRRRDPQRRVRARLAPELPLVRVDALLVTQLLENLVDNALKYTDGPVELLARMRVALRHRGTTLSPAITHYRGDGLEVDLANHHVHLRGEPLHLTPTEYKLLARLVRNTGQVVTHRALLADVWGPEFTEHTHYLRLYMAQLRAKIEPEPAEPGVGYRLADG
jgi:K+-sensing histidine kinase KdpD